MLLPAILILFFIIIFSTMIRAGMIGAPWVPTFRKTLISSIKLADIKEWETVYDLGCGDGRWLIKAAQFSPAKKIIGVEISLLPYLLAQARKLFSRHKRRIKIYYQNFYNLNLSEADVIYIFSLPKVMALMEPKFMAELKRGSRVVSLAFKLPHKEQAEIFKASLKAMPLYLYRF